MGASQRATVERHAEAFSFVSHVLATVPRVDQGRHLDHGVGTVAARTRPARPDRPNRDDCRQNVFVGKKRGAIVGKAKRGRGTNTMVLTDGHGIPLAATIASVSPAEVTLIETLLDQRVLRWPAERLIYDWAADNKPLRSRLAPRGIELITPHRRRRRNPMTQYGRKLRRYRRRWKIERSIGWLQSFPFLAAIDEVPCHERKVFEESHDA